jgi:hypothetical protein
MGKKEKEVIVPCVPWQCTAIAVQQYTEQYTFFPFVHTSILSMFLYKTECVQ